MAGSITLHPAIPCRILPRRRGAEQFNLLTKPRGVALRRMEKREDGHGAFRTEPLPCTAPFHNALKSARAGAAASSVAVPPSTQTTSRRRSGSPACIDKTAEQPFANFISSRQSNLMGETMRLIAALGAVFLGVIELLPISASALEIRPECLKMRDKIGCTCALNNGGGIRPYGKGWYSVTGRSIRRAGYPNQAFTLCVARALHIKLPTQ